MPCSDDASFYRWDGNNLLLSVYIQPRASRDEIVGQHGKRLKVRLTAPPVDGQASRHLINFLAKCFAVPNKQIELIAGKSGRNKHLRIASAKQWPDFIAVKK